MAKKKHWAVSTDDPTAGRKFRLACGMWAWINSAKDSGPLWSLCSAAVYRDLAARDPDWYCSDCAKAARLALAAESAPKADTRSDSDRYTELRRLVESCTGLEAPMSQHIADRSLVGMSQSSRKRAARQALASGGVSNRHVQVRDRYRIGERLRPCPGCVQCFVCVSCENDTCACSSHRASICDGSGVLPARRP